MLKEILCFLFARVPFKAMAYSMMSTPQNWYDHQTDIPGLVHVVYKSLTFSLVLKADRSVVILNPDGSLSPIQMRAIEQALFASCLARLHQSFVTVGHKKQVLNKELACQP